MKNRHLVFLITILFSLCVPILMFTLAQQLAPDAYLVQDSLVSEGYSQATVDPASVWGGILNCPRGFLYYYEFSYLTSDGKVDNKFVCQNIQGNYLVLTKAGH